MSMYPNPGGASRPWRLDYASDNRAVVSFFNVVYAWMAVGLAVTAAVAWFVINTPALHPIFFASRGMIVVWALGAFAIAYAVQASAMRLSATVATVLFLVYAALIGALISPIFVIYNLTTIGAAFLVTGGTFAAISVYGFVTKRDLSRMGSMLAMAVIGLFIASIVNVFVASNLFSWVITYAVLFVFIGLTAYDTQRLRQFALSHGADSNMAPRMAIVGSLMLYVSFINLFLSILRIMGDRR